VEANQLALSPSAAIATPAHGAISDPGMVIIGTDAVSVRGRRVRAFDHVLIRQRSANTVFVHIFAGSETGVVLPR
jgi:hypothetical protein